MDYVGLATLVVGVGALQILLDLGNDEDWFNSTKIEVLAIVAVIALAVFFIWEITDKCPIVDLRLCLHRNRPRRKTALQLSDAAVAPFAPTERRSLWRSPGTTHTEASRQTRT